MENNYNLNEMRNAAYSNSVAKGFYEDKPFVFAEKIALIHSEASELLDADRNNIFDVNLDQQQKATLLTMPEAEFKDYYETCIKGTPGEEYADIIIRVGDLAGYKQVDLDFHVSAKMRFNSMRPHKHGKQY